MKDADTLNWKTMAIAYQSALISLGKDLTKIKDIKATDLLIERMEQADKYIKIWWRDEV
jgi:hypothetical protein